MTTNTAHVRHHREQQRQRPAEPKNDRTVAEAAEAPKKATTPEAVQAAKVAGGSDSEKLTTAYDARRARGVDWVRPTDVIARQSATLAGRGIDFEVELARRTRRLTGQVTRAGGRGVGRVGKTLSERARRLPDVSEFGRGSRHPSWVSRSGIGWG